MQPITVTKTNSEKLDTELQTRINGVVKSQFYAITESEGVKPATKVRQLISDYIAQNKCKISQKQSKAQ